MTNIENQLFGDMERMSRAELEDELKQMRLVHHGRMVNLNLQGLEPIGPMPLSQAMFVAYMVLIQKATPFSIVGVEGDTLAQLKDVSEDVTKHEHNIYFEAMSQGADVLDGLKFFIEG